MTNAAQGQIGMTRHKAIAFRPTDEALESLAKLVKVHGDRSKAINAALEATGIMVENGLLLPKKSRAKGEAAAGVGNALPADKKPARRRTKTNATIAPDPLPPEPELRANMLRRTIQKPAWKQ